MRIIAGEWKSRRLEGSASQAIRPVMDRVKQYIFDVLADRVHDARVADIFAGSGSIGLEALSRGAGSILFVDSNAEAIRLIRRNAEMLGAMAGCTIICENARRFIEQAHDAFDLIFCDPPYRYAHTGTLVEMIGQRELLAEEGWLFVEHDPDTILPDAAGRLSLQRQKKFGRTILSIYY